MVHLCFVWSLKYPTHSDSQGWVWLHWTTTSLNMSLLFLHGLFLSSLFLFSVSALHLKLWWCGNKLVLTTLCLSTPVFLYFILAVFILLHLGSMHPPLVSCFFSLFAKEVAETVKWDSVWFHGKGKDDLVYLQPSFSSISLITSDALMERLDQTWSVL